VEFFNASILGTREKGAAPVSEGESSTWGDSWFPHGGATGGCSGVAATDSQSQIAFGLTQGGRQSVGLVGPIGCLGQILLWRLNRLPKKNGMGKRDF
jgi:hypothetical protein